MSVLIEARDNSVDGGVAAAAPLPPPLHPHTPKLIATLTIHAYLNAQNRPAYVQGEMLEACADVIG